MSIVDVSGCRENQRNLRAQVVEWIEDSVCLGGAVLGGHKKQVKVKLRGLLVIYMTSKRKMEELGQLNSTRLICDIPLLCLSSQNILSSGQGLAALERIKTPYCCDSVALW